MYPDFIGIGAQKAGTTWLSHYLQRHPEIWMPPLKEIHYFDEKIHDPANMAPRLLGKLLGRRVVDRRWRRQVATRMKIHLKRLSGRGKKRFSRESFFWDLRYYAGRPDDKWYTSLFEPGRGKVVGEITPAYSMLGPDAVARIHEMMPQAKLIFMIRNPIERAWSQAVMQFSKVENQVVDSVERERLRRNFDSKGSLLRTDYLGTLDTWRKFYPDERIFVGFLEDVSLFPAEFLERVYDFLGVDSSFRSAGVGRKVHSRSTGRAPSEELAYLARLYRDDTKWISDRFGGYASFWLYCAERLLDEPPEEEFLSYPLWNSSLWKEWAGDGDSIEPQSGSLSRMFPYGK